MTGAGGTLWLDGAEGLVGGRAIKSNSLWLKPSIRGTFPDVYLP